MKIVINECFGWFSIAYNPDIFKALNIDNEYEDVSRTDPVLIDLVEKEMDANPRKTGFPLFNEYKKTVSGLCARLKVVEIPDEATDWEIDEYDGSESIICVVDGKIRHIY